MCNKRPKNLRDRLVRADLGSEKQNQTQRYLTVEKKDTYPCLRCAQCTNVIKGDSFYHPQTGKMFKIRGYHTCNSKNFVYIIKCPCGLLYVGKTSQCIKHVFVNTDQLLEHNICSYQFPFTSREVILSHRNTK